MNNENIKDTPKRFVKITKAIKWVLVIWILGKMSGCLFMIPGPWGREVGGTLPEGDYIAFQSRSVGRESDDRLIWVDAEENRKEFWVDRSHAGFDYVVLKQDQDGKKIWVESDGKVGASLDLLTSEFRAEGEPQFEWAVYGKGIVIAEGRTWGFFSIIAPW